MLYMNLFDSAGCRVIQAHGPSPFAAFSFIPESMGGNNTPWVVPSIDVEEQYPTVWEQ